MGIKFEETNKTVYSKKKPNYTCSIHVGQYQNPAPTAPGRLPRGYIL